MPVMPACGKSRSGPVRRLCTAYDFPRCHFEIFPVCQASRLSTEVQERPQIRLPGIENLPVSTVKVCRTVTPRSRAFLGSLHRDRSLSSSRCNGGRDGHWQAGPSRTSTGSEARNCTRRRRTKRQPPSQARHVPGKLEPGEQPMRDLPDTREPQPGNPENSKLHANPLPSCGTGRRTGTYSISSSSPRPVSSPWSSFT